MIFPKEIRCSEEEGLDAEWSKIDEYPLSGQEILGRTMCICLFLKC